MTHDEFVKAFGARWFYHFTDIRNLDSIKEHGLLSLSELRRRGIQIPAPGGNDWSHTADESYGLDKYVNLCLMDRHPMEYVAKKDERIGETSFLKVKTEILGSVIQLY